MQAGSSDDFLGPKKMNYEFLLLVRQKKYAEALALGKTILKTNPDNPSVQKFCAFIQKNNTEIIKMVERQKQQEEYESADSDDSEEGDQQEEGEGKQQETDKDSSQSQDEEQEEIEEEQNEKISNKEKIQLTTCTLNQIPHICPRHHRQPNGPRAKTQQTESTQASLSSKKK